MPGQANLVLVIPSIKNGKCVAIGDVNHAVYNRLGIARDIPRVASKPIAYFLNRKTLPDLKAVKAEYGPANSKSC